jgi:hypothetical protein
LKDGDAIEAMEFLEILPMPQKQARYLRLKIPVQRGLPQKFSHIHVMLFVVVRWNSKRRPSGDGCAGAPSRGWSKHLSRSQLKTMGRRE